MIPKEWKLKTVGEIVKFSGGSQPPRKNFVFSPRKDYIRLIQIRDYKTDKYATYISKEMAKKFCNSEDIMIGRYGPPVFQIYRGLEGAYNVALIKAIPDKSALTNDYLFYFLKQESLFKLIDRLSRRSAGQSGVDMIALRKYKFPLPQISEQNKIAAVLKTWDKAIDKTDQLNKAKEKQKKAMIQQLLTGKRRFKEFKNIQWVTKELREFLSPASRPVPKPEVEYQALGIRSHGKGTFRRIVDKPDEVMMDTLYEVKKNDLIVNITFAWEGAIAIVYKSDEGSLVSHRFPTYTFNQNEVIPEYFKYVIITKRFVHNLGLISPGGAGRNRVLSKKDFLKLKVELPSIEEQTRIAEVLNTADKELFLLEQKRNALQQQKKGLMQKLLTGKIRVKI